MLLFLRLSVDPHYSFKTVFALHIPIPNNHQDI